MKIKYIVTILYLILYLNAYSQFQWNEDKTIYSNEFNSTDGFDYFVDNDIKDNALPHPKLYKFEDIVEDIDEYFLRISLGSVKALVNTKALKTTNSTRIVFNFIDWENYCGIEIDFLNNGNFAQVYRMYKGQREVFCYNQYLNTSKVSDNYFTIKFNKKTLKSEIKTSFAPIMFCNEIPLNTKFVPNIGVTSFNMSINIDNVSCELIKEKEQSKNSKMIPIEQVSSGSGFFISNNGYLITNHHVVNGGKTFKVVLNSKEYTAKLVKSDISNDLALLKVTDYTFQNFKSIPFVIKAGTISLGEKVFSLGYPLTDVQGKNIKLTDGIISSKTGYMDDPVCYQISVPLQPGNSGGPLFDMKGNLVGVVNAGILEANSVGYAIKSTYLNNFLDVIQELPPLNTVNSLTGKTLPQLTDVLTNYCCLIVVTN